MANLNTAQFQPLGIAVLAVSDTCPPDTSGNTLVVGQSGSCCGSHS